MEPETILDIVALTNFIFDLQRVIVKLLTGSSIHTKFLNAGVIIASSTSSPQNESSAHLHC